MHQSSLNNMKMMLDRVLPEMSNQQTVTIVDYGGRRIDGHDSYYSLVQNISNVKYIGLDIEDGPGVDVVSIDPYCTPFEDNSVDIVITGQMFEHCEFFWLTIKDMARIIRPGGYILAITPASGPVHRYPVDCWRFYPDAYAALCKWADLKHIDSWQDPAGKWYDQVGIMKKTT